MISAAWPVLTHPTVALGSEHQTGKYSTKEDTTHVIIVNSTVSHPVSPLLYGVFIEEVLNLAGLWGITQPLGCQEMHSQKC